jgi:hypothetical protein
MSNGAEDTYQVIDPGFHEKLMDFPSHYQMQVKKLGIPEAKRAIHSITYNISGPNARINQNSVDNSININEPHTESLDLIYAIRDEITKLKIEKADRIEANEVVDAVEEQIKSGKPKKVVISALLNALPHVASIASLGKAIIEKL